MKTLLTLLLFLACVGIAEAQTNYNVCGTYDYEMVNNSTTPEDIFLDVDADGGSDIQFVWGINPDYGKMLYVAAVNPMNGQHNYNSVAFRKNSSGVLNRYQLNEPIQSGLNNFEYYGGTAILFAETGFVNEFAENSTGYFVYRQDRGYIPPDEPFEDTTFFFCMGWIKMQIGNNYDNSILVSSCGCSYSNMITGQSLPTAVEETLKPTEVYAVLDGNTLLVNNLTPQNYDFKLYSMTGSLVIEGKTIQGLRQIDVGNLSPGIYILKYSNGKTTRLVK